MNAAAYLLATGQASATALECGAERLNYGELRAAVGRAAGAWRVRGLEHETQAREHLDAGIAALPKLKRPRLVKWVSEPPLTATGKLQRGKLKQQYLGGAA